MCIEESYDPEHFHGRVERFPFDDNHVPPIEMIKQFCESVHAWLSSDPKNIAVIHCMVHFQFFIHFSLDNRVIESVLIVFRQVKVEQD